MKKLYQTFFHIPKCRKVPEKVFLSRMILSAVTMLVSLVVLCSATLAYFTASITSGNNTIRTAAYQLTITSGEGVTVQDDGYVCAGNQEHIYTFTLVASGSAEKGYCKIYLEGDVNSPYFTDQINQGAVTIQIKATDDTVVRFEPCWGTSSVYAEGGDTIGDGEMIVCASIETLTDTPTEPDTNDE